MELSDGCASVLFWLIVVWVVGVFLVLPIYSYLALGGALGWGYPLLSIGIFSYFAAEFFDLADSKAFNIVYNVFISFASLVTLRDLFVSDVRAGLDLVLSIPIGLLIYHFLFEPLAEKGSEVGREVLLKVLGLLGNVVVNGLIFLIMNFVL